VDKRIAEAGDSEGSAKILEELADRYGPVPGEVCLLLRFAVLKSLAERLKIESIERKQGAIQIKFHPESRIDPGKLMDLVASQPGAQFTPAGVLRLPAPAESGGLVDSLEKRLAALS
jgi:transcription-repair coupling factor (superfamily II helicase)